MVLHASCSRSVSATPACVLLLPSFLWLLACSSSPLESAGGDAGAMTARAGEGRAAVDAGVDGGGADVPSGTGEPDGGPADAGVDVAVTPAETVQEARLLWARRAGGSGDDRANALVELASGEVLMGGGFHGRATFDEPVDMPVELESVGELDAFLAVYRPDGQVVRAESFGSGWQDEVNDLARAHDDAVLMTGHFSERTVFGPGADEPTILHAGDTTDAMVVWLDPSGGVTPRAVQISGVASEWGAAIAPAGEDAVVAGNFHGTAIFDLGQPAAIRFGSDVSRDMFVARYGPQGELHWAAQMESAVSDVHGIGACADGSVWVVGESAGAAVYDPGLPTELAIEPHPFGWFEAFIARSAVGELVGSVALEVRPAWW